MDKFTLKGLFLSAVVVLLAAVTGLAAADGQASAVFAGSDLHLKAEHLISYQPGTDLHILTFREGFTLAIGDNQLSSTAAVLWLKSVRTEYLGVVKIEYSVEAYLQGDVSIKKGAIAKAVGLEITETQINGVKSIVAKFTVTGEVFITAEDRLVKDPRGSGLFKNAEIATGRRVIKQVPVKAPRKPETPKPGSAAGKVLAPDDSVPQKSARKQIVRAGAAKPEKAKPQKRGVLKNIFSLGRKKPSQAVPAKKVRARAQPLPPDKKPFFQYPIHISGVGGEPAKMQSERLPDGSGVATIIGRFYIWQKQDENGRMLELQADNAVIFYSEERPPAESAPSDKAESELLTGGVVQAIYLSGDAIMSQGTQVIRADEVYYDFRRRQGLIINADMKNFDTGRGIPIYVKAQRLRQLSQSKFAGEDIVITSSEFYKPSPAMTASDMVITDTTAIDEKTGELGDDSFDADMRNIRLTVNDRTVFYWPKFRSNLQRPDIPIRKATMSYDNTWGPTIETEWYLARLLGLREPKGHDSTFLLDYYGKRGMGVGTEILYNKEDYFGNIGNYIIYDSGQDDLGKNRKNLEPSHKIRGRFLFQHRHFLPYDWQLTLEASYLSDRNFLESYHRREFQTGKDQETLVHLKRIKDNWGFAILGKWRINDFQTETEETPSAQFHLTGQSLFNDNFTFYHDSELGYFHQRLPNNSTMAIPTQRYVFGSTRNELDMPIQMGSFKLVPFIAGTIGYDERTGFSRTMANGSGGPFGEKQVFLGELGLRASTHYWKVYPNAKSRLWDINGIRHIVKPYLVAVGFAESDKVIEQKDSIHIGLLQRWQTKRGDPENRRTVEWMRLNMNFTLLNNPSSRPKRADKYIWHKPFVPMEAMSATNVFNSDLAANTTFQTYGPQRDSFNADYIWRISDTTAILSDINFDIHNGTVEQFNIGFSQMRWPNFSYYIGSRYLRSTVIGKEKGSNPVTFAATYKISPRYMLSVSYQYDFDYGEKIINEITLIRRYHRICYGITYYSDPSVGNEAIILSIWPQGVNEISVGNRRYLGLDSPAKYY